MKETKRPTPASIQRNNIIERTDVNIKEKTLSKNVDEDIRKPSKERTATTQSPFVLLSRFSETYFTDIRFCIEKINENILHL